MSISSAVSPQASQALAALLPQNGPSASTGASSTNGTTPHFAAHATHSSAPTALTGSATPSLSNEILSLLTQMQQMGGGGGSGSSTSSSVTLNSLSMSSLTLGSLDPMQQLMSALDDNSAVTDSQTASGMGQTGTMPGQSIDTFLPAPDSAAGTAVGAGSVSNAVTPATSLSGNTLPTTNFTQIMEGFKVSQSAVPQDSMASSLLNMFAKVQGAAAASATNGIIA